MPSGALTRLVAGPRTLWNAAYRIGFHWISRRTIRGRLVGLYLLIFGSTLGLFSGLLYQTFINHQQNQFDIALFNHAIDIAQGITVGSQGELLINPDLLSTGGKIFPFPAGTAYIQIYSPTGEEIGRSRTLGATHLPLDANNLELLPHTRAVFQTITLDADFPLSSRGWVGHSPTLGRGLIDWILDWYVEEDPGEALSKSQAPEFRLLTALSPGQLDRNFILQVAAPLQFILQTNQDLKHFLMIGVVATLLIATLGALFGSRRALSPIRRMMEEANRLSPEHLSDRIAVPTAQDELRSLALTLNELLQRLQRAFESQDRFIANASHELKTPLAILRGELEVFSARARSATETATMVKNSLQEITHLSILVEDLLTLARVDAGRASVLKRAVALDEVVLGVIAFLERLAVIKEIRIRTILEEPAEHFNLVGDSELLYILAKNLLENAIKYSLPHSVIEIFLLGDPQSVELVVRDEGPGILAAEQSKIFDRFYRVGNTADLPYKDSSPTPSSGAGLGLALVQVIAEIHGGRVRVVSPAPSIGAPPRLEVIPSAQRSGSEFRVRMNRF